MERAVAVEKPTALQVNAIYTENIERENKHIRLVEHYQLTPGAVQTIVYATKPNTKAADPAHAQMDTAYLDLVAARNTHIRDKQNIPLTTSQEYGWDSADAAPRAPESLLHHPRVKTEIRQYGVSVALGRK